MKHDERIYLQHLLMAISRIESYIQGLDEKTFITNLMAQDAVIRQIEIIGEAAKHLSTDFRAKYPTVPWQAITGMRDKLIHDYFGVDLEKVWLTTQDDIPDLKELVIRILSELDSDDD